MANGIGDNDGDINPPSFPTLTISKGKGKATAFTS